MLKQNKDTIYKTIFSNLVWNTFHDFQTSAWNDLLLWGGIIWRKKNIVCYQEKIIELYKYRCKIINLTLQFDCVNNFSASMQHKIITPPFFTPVYVIDPREIQLHSKHFKWNGFNCITLSNEENSYNLGHCIYFENKFQNYYIIEIYANFRLRSVH